ncbi:sensor histidine kinase [Brachybacterium sp. YJGR34]|uniref:sensor histidine kinase n=1 Tax=Brachybacterium sp. YJGR34 TaxID=2059911 RepID=UPI000E0BC9B3|nr:histidine kinase [Brachybacterium sp. YJGR34]
MTTTSGRQWGIFFAYTAYSVLTMVVMAPLGVLLLLGARLPGLASSDPVVTAMLVAQIAAGAWSTWRTMRSWSTGAAGFRHGRWDLPQLGRIAPDRSVVIVLALGAAIAVATFTAGSDALLLASATTVVMGTVGICAPWWISSAAALAVGIAAIRLGAPAPLVAVGVAVGVAAVTTIRATLWLAAVVRELDDARAAQTQLAVAEERLRFARDLHDVTGRDLSVIAVKSELVAQLAERGDPRAVEHGREVAQIARGSLAEIRALVRGYREADLAAELRGTVSLLRSAQVEVEVHGGAQVVPADRAEQAAWVLREGGTNMLRHAAPRQASIALGAEGLRLVNDGVHEDGAVHEGAGLTGMRERLGPGSSLTTRREDGRFTLDVRFDTSGDPR